MLGTKISIYLLILLIALLVESVILSYADPTNNFKVIVLGSGGGPFENNLSSYLISPSNENNYVALDAGTILHGLNIANSKGSFDDIDIPKKSGVTPEFFLLQNNIKGYLITHSHLDHISGLITSSPYDTNKSIYGLPSTIEYISKNLFNWQIWPNFGNEGMNPNLNKYNYIKMSPGEEYAIRNSSMKVKAFPLSHSNNYISTAFLIRSDSKYILYIGDTGPDEIENSENLDNLWNNIAPLIIAKKLSALFFECSFTNDRPDNMLYGHLTPKWLLFELNKLSLKVNNGNLKNGMDGMPVVITHIKVDPKSNVDSKKIINADLKENNNLGVKFIIPDQGDKLLF